MREKAIAGSRVTVAVAKGKKGKKFRTLGKGKVNSQGVFKVRFRLARGTYRVRYSFSGNSVVAKGTAYEVDHDPARDPLSTDVRGSAAAVLDRSITVARRARRREAVQPRREPRVGVQVHRRGFGTPLVHVRSSHAVDGEAHRPAPHAIS